MKKILVAFSIVTLLMPSVAGAVSPESLTPQGSLGTVDFQMTEKIKKILSPLLNLARTQANESGDDTPEKTQTLFDMLTSGNRLFLSAQSASEQLMFFPATPAQWATISKDLTKKETYGGSDIYTEEGAFETYLNGFIVVTTDDTNTDTIHHVIDLASGKLTDSLANNSAYAAFTSDYLSPRFLGFTANIKKIFEEFVASAPQFSTLNTIDMEGGSIAETATGYAFNGNLKGDPEAMKKQDFLFNPGGSFTPHFYTQFPGGAPIFYAESTNAKASYDQFKKNLNQLKESDAGIDAEALISDAIGSFSLDDFFAPLTKEVGFAVQYDKTTAAPMVTFMANVKDNLAAGQKIAEDLAKVLKNSLDKKDVVNIKKENGFTVLTLKNNSLKTSVPALANKVSITVGVTSEGLLIISSYPNIQNAATRTGLQINSDFAAAAAGAGSVTGFSYTNMRTFWQWLDDFFASQDTAMETYTSYYQALEYLYGGKEIVVTTTGDNYTTAVHGTITVDSAKHAPLRDTIKTLRTADSNDDGVSDFESLYLYHVPVDLGQDTEGTSVIWEQLKKGVDPSTNKKLFNDLPEDSYYGTEVSSLKLGGTINGYSDGSFKPGKPVTRAEFVTMIVNAFDVPRAPGGPQGLYLSYDSLTANSFEDVDRADWFAQYIDRAFAAGIVSGTTIDGRHLMRPNDTITRAEAAIILSRAAQTLKSDVGVASCASGPFEDVRTSDWFCGAVAKAYKNDIIKGKTATQFKPYDTLNRADAAVLIQRTLKKDLESVDGAAKAAPLEIPQFLLPNL